MSEFSFWWTTNAAGSGDQVATYSQAHLATLAEILAGCSGFEGVAPSYLSALRATSPSVNTVRVQPGGAVVDGKVYHNDANEDIAIPSASGGGNVRNDRIVIRVSWASFTARLFHIQNGSVNTPAPAITQTPGTTYDIKLYQVQINSSGVITLTDETDWAFVGVDDTTLEHELGVIGVKDGGIDTTQIANSAVETAKINNLAVTEAKLATQAVTRTKLQTGAVGHSQISLDGTTGTLQLNRLTSTQRDAIGFPLAGMIIYNTTERRIEFYDSSSGWRAVTHTAA